VQPTEPLEHRGRGQGSNEAAGGSQRPVGGRVGPGGWCRAPTLGGHHTPGSRGPGPPWAPEDFPAPYRGFSGLAKDTRPDRGCGGALGTTWSERSHLD
jgi:hypothetical protein